MAVLQYDVIVVGGGPAGIAGALLLGRCRRSVLVLDSGDPRNGRTMAVHGYLTREGMAPAVFHRHARAELEPYNVQWRTTTVLSISADGDGFRVGCTQGRTYRCRKVLLATGVCDHVPAIEGADACYGKSMFHCPYCDAWEVRDTPIAVLAKGRNAAHFALLLHGWSADVALFTNGPSGLLPADREHLRRAGIPVHTARITRLVHRHGLLSALALANGTVAARSSLFFATGFKQHCELPAMLGCRLYRTGTVITDRKQGTGVPGVYVAGDAAIGTHFVSVAAAEGAKAAVAINGELLDDGLERRALL